MPDNRLPGALEHFVQEMLPEDDNLFPYAQECVTNLPTNPPKFPEHHRIKAEIHTWLAWQEQPGTQMGAAITRHYLDSDTEQAQMFLSWLQRLFPTN